MKTTLKKIFLVAALLISAPCLKAQDIFYYHHLLEGDGCTVSFSSIYNNDTAYLIVSIKSEGVVFSDNPTMMLRFFDTDQVLILHGTKIQTTQENGAYILYPTTKQRSMAQFQVTELEMALFKSGIEKVRISTLPTTHEHIFQKDKIGALIYQDYLQTKMRSFDF